AAGDAGPRLWQWAAALSAAGPGRRVARDGRPLRRRGSPGPGPAVRLCRGGGAGPPPLGTRPGPAVAVARPPACRRRFLVFLVVGRPLPREARWLAAQVLLAVRAGDPGPGGPAVVPGPEPTPAGPGRRPPGGDPARDVGPPGLANAAHARPALL